MARQHRIKGVTAGRTLIRRYVLALAPAGAAMRPRLQQPRVPPLSGGTGSHGAAHAFTIADSRPARDGYPFYARLSAPEPAFVLFSGQNGLRHWSAGGAARRTRSDTRPGLSMVKAAAFRCLSTLISSRRLIWIAGPVKPWAFACAADYLIKRRDSKENWRPFSFFPNVQLRDLLISCGETDP